jgi:KaiC/GvpD/RAD55 family RecA-like ATPase
MALADPYPVDHDGDNYVHRTHGSGRPAVARGGTAMTDRLPTGIRTLDRKLGDGIPAGNLVALSASPASQSEQFLRDITGSRQTLVVTTRRPRKAVERSMYRTSPRPENVTVREVSGDDPLRETYSLTSMLSGTANVIVDPVDPLERASTERYADFLNAVRKRAHESGSLVFLHCLDGHAVPEQRDVTQYIADVVFELTTTVRGDTIQNRLVVPKFRDGEPFKEPLKLELTNEVSIDTSRDIG